METGERVIELNYIALWLLEDALWEKNDIFPTAISTGNTLTEDGYRTLALKLVIAMEECLVGIVAEVAPDTKDLDKEQILAALEKSTTQQQMAVKVAVAFSEAEAWHLVPRLSGLKKMPGQEHLYAGILLSLYDLLVQYDRESGTPLLGSYYSELTARKLIKDVGLSEKSNDNDADENKTQNGSKD